MNENRVIIYLKNGFRYTGHIISQKEQLIDFYDEVINDSVLINKDSVSVVTPIKEKRLK